MTDKTALIVGKLSQLYDQGKGFPLMEAIVQLAGLVRDLTKEINGLKSQVAALTSQAVSVEKKAGDAKEVREKGHEVEDIL